YAQWDGLPSKPAAALLTGESGPLLVAWRLSPSDELADDLLVRVRENRGNEAVEIMWGAPGTALAAKAMLDWTSEDRWREAWLESAGAVWAMRDADGLWTNCLYGETFRRLTPPPGLVGTVPVLCRALEERRGEGRYSLWTGDVGVALFAADCIEGVGRYPILDAWD